MATAIKNRKSKSAKSRYIGKHGGLIQQRVQQTGPEHYRQTLHADLKTDDNDLEAMSAVQTPDETVWSS